MHKKWKLDRIGLCACLCIFPAVLPGCKKKETAPATAQILRISQRNEPADLDPALVTLPDEFFIIRALSEGLVRPAPTGGQEPAAADRWEVSAEGLIYTFHLRPGAQWSNGEPVTAGDFLESYRRVLTPATAAPKAELFFAVKNARAFLTGAITDFNDVGFHTPDAQTLVVVLEQPSPRFLAYAASGPWIPVNPRVVAQHGRQWTRPENFVGNGPFTLAEWQPHQRIVVKKNSRYSEAARVRLDEIDFVAFDNEGAEERAYRTGQIDLTMAVPNTKLATYASERPSELHHAPLAETRYLTFNTHRPPLDDPRVRHALALALDRRRIVERVLLGGQEPAFRFVPPFLRAANDHDAHVQGELREDPEVARRLLAAAGFPGGRGFPRLELSSWYRTPVLEALQEMWKKELGIEVTISTHEAKVHMAALADGHYDIGFMTGLPDVADARDVLQNFTSEAAGNYPHWSDAPYDALLAELARTGTIERQAWLCREAEARLGEICPVTPLYFNARNWLMSPHVRGWQEDELWTRFYHDVYLQEN
jgi:oligopeptide transport system substrate-binding protein